MTQDSTDKNENAPANIYFVDLLRYWAISVARGFVWRVNRSEGPNAAKIDECWIDVELDLYVRYQVNDRKLGVRYERLDVDYLTGFPLPHNLREHASGSSMGQASNLVDGGLESQSFGPVEWTDKLGYAWWGTAPDDGWITAIENAQRVATIK